MVRRSCSQVFYKMSILKKFAKLRRKHQCWSNSKIFLSAPFISIVCFSIFRIYFFLLMKFLNTSAWREFHLIKLQETGTKGVLVELLEKYLGMCAGLWSNVCVCFWTFGFFLRFFVRFVNKEVYEIVLDCHELLACVDRRENDKRFHSWQTKLTFQS